MHWSLGVYIQGGKGALVIGCIHPGWGGGALVIGCIHPGWEGCIGHWVYTSRICLHDSRLCNCASLSYWLVKNCIHGLKVKV